MLCAEWWEFAEGMSAIILALVNRGYIMDDCFRRLGLGLLPGLKLSCFVLFFLWGLLGF